MTTITEVDFDIRELYLIEKTMDNLRDDMLKGIAQHISLSQKDKSPEPYKEMIKKQSVEFVETWDMVNTLCCKLEQARLNHLRKIKAKPIEKN